MKKRKRYNFWGKKIEYKIPQEKEDVEEEIEDEMEERESTFYLFWIIIGVVGILAILLFMFPMLSNMPDILTIDDTIEYSTDSSEEDITDTT